tara:strand:+ start:1764 stop:2249 length:486 start_codon:yes stop_codon:yes gene_type:complete
LKKINMMAGTGTTSKLKGARKERKEGFDDDVDAAVAAPAVEPTTTTNQAPRRFIGTAAFEFSAEEGELSLKKDDKVIVFPDLVSPAGWWVATTNFTDTFTLQDIGLVPCDFLADPIMPASAEDAVPAVKLEVRPTCSPSFPCQHVRSTLTHTRRVSFSARR